MNIIVPLTNENYYNLELDNITITNEIIISTIEIINSNLSSNKKISKIIELIKKVNNIGVFDILINVLPYPIWISWFKNCFILKYYWNDELIKRIEDSNKFKIIKTIVYYDNNKIQSLEVYNNYKFELDKLLIILTDSYDLNYNYSSKILEKRLFFIYEILNNYIENFDLKNYFGCEKFIFMIGYNKLFKKNFNNFIDKNIIVKLYPKLLCSFKVKKFVNYRLKNNYLIIKINNFIIMIYKKIVNDINIFSLTNGYLNFETFDIKVNANFYQKFNLPFDNIINSNLENFDEIFKADDNTWFKSYSEINISKIIKNNFQKCYECKKIWDGYSLPDYKFHCLQCGIKNYKWREEKANLNGLTIFITGIRVKIGFTTTLRLLRSGAKVIGTTRYPNFALYNYSKEKDYEVWKGNLIIIQVDFLVLDSVYNMLDYLNSYELNGFINMAFRTIRSSDYYTKSVEKIEDELKSNIIFLKNKIDNSELVISKFDTQIYNNLNIVSTDKIINYQPDIKINKFNDVQEIPHENSWDQTIDKIDPKEIVECVAINQLVPTLLINKLKNKFINGHKFIINVDSYEGQFETTKTDKHIHTNMCKSALNMLIRSLEEDDDKNLHVHTINPGYVTGVKITPDKTDYPIDPLDAASRITWPIFQYANNNLLDKSWTKINYYEHAKW